MKEDDPPVVAVLLHPSSSPGPPHAIAVGSRMRECPFQDVCSDHVVDARVPPPGWSAVDGHVVAPLGRRPGLLLLLHNYSI